MSSNPEESLHTLKDPGLVKYFKNMLEQEQGGDQEQLLRSNGQQSADDSERALAGRERERIITLPVRRMFCALVIFDVVLTFIMWYIYFDEVLLFL